MGQINQEESRRKPARKAAIVEEPEAGSPIPEATLVTSPPPRARKEFGIRATFGIDLGFEEDANGKQVKDKNGKPIPKERPVTGYAEPTQWTPQIDPGYVFPPEETKVFLLGLELKDRTLLVGDTGSGKTTLAEQVAARLNYSCVRINFDNAVTRQDLVGEWVVKGRQMEFQYGVLVHAFRMEGCIIILDELDRISGECAFVIQRPLEKNDGKILVMETGGELIALHPDSAIVATANTKGMGDDSGLYAHGCQVLSYAMINRFGLTIEVNYMKAEQEQEMLMKKCPELTPQEATALVAAVNGVREAYKHGELSAPLSSRDLLNWADKYVRMGDPLRAARYCFLNRMPVEDAMTAEQLIKRSFAEA